MARCDQCGNDYHDPMTVTRRGERFTFDCFECAIHKLAPACAQCGTRIVGHGLESDTAMYCCGHCAEQAGDRAHA